MKITTEWADLRLTCRVLESLATRLDTSVPPATACGAALSAVQRHLAAACAPASRHTAPVTAALLRALAVLTPLQQAVRTQAGGVHGTHEPLARLIGRSATESPVAAKRCLAQLAALAGPGDSVCNADEVPASAGAQAALNALVDASARPATAPAAEALLAQHMQDERALAATLGHAASCMRTLQHRVRISDANGPPAAAQNCMLASDALAMLRLSAHCVCAASATAPGRVWIGGTNVASQLASAAASLLRSHTPVCSRAADGEREHVKLGESDAGALTDAMPRAADALCAQTAPDGPERSEARAVLQRALVAACACISVSELKDCVLPPLLALECGGPCSAQRDALLVHAQLSQLRAEIAPSASACVSMDGERAEMLCDAARRCVHSLRSTARALRQHSGATLRPQRACLAATACGGNYADEAVDGEQSLSSVQLLDETAAAAVVAQCRSCICHGDFDTHALARSELSELVTASCNVATLALACVSSAEQEHALPADGGSNEAAPSSIAAVRVAASALSLARMTLPAVAQVGNAAVYAAADGLLASCFEHMCAGAHVRGCGGWSSAAQQCAAVVSSLFDAVARSPAENNVAGVCSVQLQRDGVTDDIPAPCSARKRVRLTHAAPSVPPTAIAPATAGDVATTARAHALVLHAIEGTLGLAPTPEALAAGMPDLTTLLQSATRALSTVCASQQRSSQQRAGDFFAVGLHELSETQRRRCAQVATAFGARLLAVRAMAAHVAASGAELTPGAAWQRDGNWACCERAVDEAVAQCGVPQHWQLGTIAHSVIERSDATGARERASAPTSCCTAVAAESTAAQSQMLSGCAGSAAWLRPWHQRGENGGGAYRLGARMAAAAAAAGSLGLACIASEQLLRASWDAVQGSLRACAVALRACQVAGVCAEEVAAGELCSFMQATASWRLCEDCSEDEQCERDTLLGSG